MNKFFFGMMITGQYDCLVLTREHDYAVSFAIL